MLVNGSSIWFHKCILPAAKPCILYRSCRNLNENFFANGIVSKHHAYLAGWIVTDSHLQKNHNAIEFNNLQYRDYNVLERIKNITECNKKITFWTDKRGAAYCKLNLYSKALFKDTLNLFPCDTHNKAATLSSSIPLFQNNGELVPTYIRGISDGNGCFGFGLRDGRIVWGLAGGNIEFQEGIQQLIFAGCNVMAKFRMAKQKSGRIFPRLRIENQQDLLNFCEWLYEDNNENLLMLHRKYQRRLLISQIFCEELSPSKRRYALAQHLIQEYSDKKDILNDLVSLMHNTSSPFKFNQTFINRIDLVWKKYDEEGDRLRA
eukprot:56123_1